jgi:hypothetical protein
MFFSLISCENNNKSIKIDNNYQDSLLILKNDKIQKQNKIVKNKSLSNYVSNSENYHWCANHEIGTQYMCQITFHDEYAIYWYHGQCQYYYFTNYIDDNKIELEWTYKSDCILDMSVIGKSNGLKKYPHQGDSFAIYTLINDTVIRVKYFFPDWTKKVNEIMKDSVYPTYLYLIK